MTTGFLGGIPIIKPLDNIGVAAEAADRKFKGLEQRAKDVKVATDRFGLKIPPTTAELWKLGAGLEGVGDEGKETARQVRDVQKSLEELADPVFRAKQATERFEEVLEEVQSDLIVTEQEADDLSEAYGEMMSATADVNADNLDAYERQGTDALGRLDDNVKISEGVLTGLPVAADTAFAATEAAFLELIKAPMTVKVVATLPPQSAFQAATRRAIEQMRRRGEFGGGFQP